ncbi:MAG: hypothetical protein RIA09_16255 [Hoeflea sp.]|jgi:hypothetical protein|uniref:hypothetical protein n=1 Tax=Hoeflea sp. TaxID=1940281 RepID=UPI0032F07C03
MTVHHSDPAMGNLNYERIDDDFYPTPSWMTHGLLGVASDQMDSPIDLTVDWWEPACGEGHISKVVRERSRGKECSTDLVPRGYGVGGIDFLKEKRRPNDTRLIITNPPYGDLAEDFIRHSLDLMKPVDGAVVMLLRNEYDCAKKRQYLFDHPAYHGKAIATSRPRWIAGTKGSPRHNYSWFLWNWKPSNHPPRIYYFNKT